MNTDTHSYREKGRAVFLAAIMVLSMVAGVAVFAAPAAAQSGTVLTGPVHFDSGDVNVGGFNATNSDGVIEVTFDDTIEETNSSADLNVTIAGQEFSLINASSETVNSVSYINGADNQLVVNTTALSGLSGIDDNGIAPRVESISGTLVFDNAGEVDLGTVPVDFLGTTLTGGEDPNVFRGTQVAVVNSAADFSVDVDGVNEGDFRGPSSGTDSQVTIINTGDLTLDDYEVTGDVTSNFTLRNLNLDASLDSTELNNEGDPVSGTVTGVQDNRDILVQTFNADDEVVNETTLEDAQITGGADFSFPNSAYGTGDFTVEVTDLASGITTDELSFSVGEAPEGSVAFAEGTTEVPTGDNAEVTVNFGGDVDDTTIEIGANRDDYGFNFTVTDEDGSGSATFVLNTFEMNDTSGGIGTVVTAPGDGSSVSTFQDGGSGQGSAADRLSPIQLRMAAISSADQDRAQLVLTERETESLSTHIAPEGSLPSNLGDLDGEAVENFIQDVQTPSETVAEGDDLVFLIQANGIFSYVDSESTLESNQGVSFTLTQQDSGLQTPEQFTPTDDGVIEGVFFDEDDERVVVVADSTNSTLADGGVFEASFSIDGASSPYVEDEGAGPEEEVTSEVEVVDPEMSFDIVEGDTYEVVPEDGAQVFGSTNLAPGTDVTVNAAGDFFVTNDTEVTEDGFVATLDFESNVDNLNTDQEFELSADGGLASAEATGAFADTPEDEQQTDAAELEQQVAELEQQLEDRNTTIDELNNEIDSLTEELNNTEDQLSTVEDERAELQNELANAEATIGDLESQVSDLESTNSDLESQVSDLESQVSELEGADEDLQTVLDELGVDSVDAAVDEIQTLRESGDSDGSGPGFGIAAALVALIAAALLAVRRRD